MASIINVDQIKNAAGTSGLTLDSSTGKASFPSGATLPAGSVLQVTPLSTSTASTNYQSTSFVDITGLSIAMTPFSASSDIYVTFSFMNYHISGGGGGIQVMQDGSAVANQGSVPSYENYSGGSDLYSRIHKTVLISAGSTNSRTYTLQIRTYSTITVQANPGASQSFMYAVEVAR